MSTEIGDNSWLEVTGAAQKKEQELQEDCDSTTSVGSPGRYVSIHCSGKMGHKGDHAFKWKED